ncbi:MAG: Crp/Fnr family transcriptional regulator [Alphaproteobacteria bacterium]|nr:Crp/Fnr family transcriptional regulator [Alphaproteobacteria bacterium]
MALPQAGSSTIETETSPDSAKLRPRASTISDTLVRRGVVVKARRRQRLTISGTDQVFVVKNGLLVMSANAGSDRRQLLTLHYPGDVFSMDLAPPLDGIGLVAMTDSDLIRIRRSALDDFPEEARRFDEYVAESALRLHARAALHIARLASLPSEPRVAAFILELALRSGHVTNDQVSCDLPLSRCEIADYLSLNADTLSRIMTRLKERGAIATVGRSRTIVKSIKRLCEEVPVCAATVALHGQGEKIGQ